MKKLLPGVLLCLLLGAAVNLAVSWTLALRVDPRAAPPRPNARERPALIADRIISPDEPGAWRRRFPPLPRLIPSDWAHRSDRPSLFRAFPVGPDYSARRTLDLWSLVDQLVVSPDAAVRRATRRALHRVARSADPEVAARAADCLGDEDIAWVVRYGGAYERDPTLAGAPVVRLDFLEDDVIRPIRAPVDSDLARLTQFPHVTELSLRVLEISGKALRRLAPLTELRSLDLSGTDFDDDGLVHLSRLPRLRELHLAGCFELTDEGLAGLEGLETLETLDLALCRGVDGSGVGHLRALPNLRALALGGQERGRKSWRGMSDAHAHLLGDLVGLRTLSLRHTRITDAGLAKLIGLRDLEALDLRDTSVTDAGLAHLTKLARLRWLNLSYTEITDAGLEQLAELEELEHLFLQGTGVTGAGLANLARLTGLRTLDITETAIASLTPDALRDLEDLEVLLADPRRIAFRDAVRLPSLFPRMTLADALANTSHVALDDEGRIIGLNLWERPVTDDDLAILASMPDLAALDLRGTDVTDDGLRHLVGLEQMIELRLGPRVTDDGLCHLGRLTRLLKLDTEGTAVTFEGIRRLIVEAQGRSLAEALEVSPFGGMRTPYGGRLSTRLDLRRIGISDEDLASLARTTDAAVLLVGRGAVTDDGATHLARLKNLHTLSLEGEAITGRTLRALAGSEALATLWLAETGVTSGDLVHLADLPELRALNVAGAPIDDSAVGHLSELESLTALIIEGGALSPEALAALRAAKPDLVIHESQRRALAGLRGRARTTHWLPWKDDERPPETRDVKVRWAKGIPGTCGDEHLEIAEEVEVSERWYGEGVEPGAPTAARVRHLRELPTITTLRLSGAPGRAAIPYVKDLPHLRVLFLSGRAIDDEALRHLAGLTRLQVLGLSGVAVTDDGLVHLAGLERLRRLRIADVEVDAGLRHVASLANLEEFELYRTSLSDATLASLRRLSNLECLVIAQSRVTPDGIATLALELPDTEIQSR